jgi:hypothetical protein
MCTHVTRRRRRGPPKQLSKPSQTFGIFQIYTQTNWESVFIGIVLPLGVKVSTCHTRLSTHVTRRGPPKQFSKPSQTFGIFQIYTQTNWESVYIGTVLSLGVKVSTCHTRLTQSRVTSHYYDDNDTRCVIMTHESWLTRPGPLNTFISITDIWYVSYTNTQNNGDSVYMGRSQ